MSKVRVNEFEAGTTIFLRGSVQYSHIGRLTTDEERIENNRRKENAAKAKNPNAQTYGETRNYTSLTLLLDKGKDSFVRVDVRNKPADSKTVELAKQYVKEHWYQKDGKTFFTAMSKSSKLPDVGVSKDGNLYSVQSNCKFDEGKNAYVANNPDAEFKRLDGELERGLDVTIVLRIFAPANNTNKGISLSYVVVNGDLKVRRSSGDNAAANIASALGLTYSAPPADAKVTYTESTGDEAEDIITGEPDPTDDPFTVTSDDSDTDANPFGADGRFISAGDHAPDAGSANSNNDPF